MGEITYMDCWQFIAPLIPANSNYAQEIYVKTFQALKEAEKRRKQEANGSMEDKP